MKVYKHKIVARFGLMHMVGTNLSVWLNVLVQETKHEILTFYDPENKTIGLSHRLGKIFTYWTSTATNMQNYVNEVFLNFFLQN